MAKNKDDEFDFEWDDDSSFDSKLDNFDGDVSEYHSDEIKSADKDRNPVASKLKSITPTINDAGSAFIAGAGKGIGRAIEDDMPEVYQAYQQGTHVLSEARIARQEISDKFRPWWNDTKRAVRRLSQQLEGQIPFGLDKKILKLIGEEDRDQQYKQPSKESLRQEQMNSNISQIFELQMQKSMEQQKDAVLNRTYDRRVDAIRHKESAGFLAKIAESAVFHQAFTNSVFTAYLKKDLELKYKQFYATEDILGVMTNHAKAVDTKLDAVIKNTALPEADKIYMSERIIGKAKENVANNFNDKLNNYFSKMRENLVSKFRDAIDWAELIPEMLNMQSDMLETANDEDMQGLGGNESFGNDNPFTKKGLMKLGFGKIGDFFGRRVLRKLTSKLPQETLESLKYYFGGGQNGLALLTDDLARGRLKGLPSGLRSLLRSIAPRLNDTTQTIVNESWQTLHEGGKITNKFIQAVEEVIPGYLKMQTRYLEILATGKDSGLLEWDPKKHTFRTQQELLDEFARSISINDNDKARRADIRIRKGTADTTQLIQHVSDSYGSNKVVIKDKLLKAQRTSARDIELFKVNLAHSEDYWRIDESILAELNEIANAKSDSEIHKTSLWKADMFKGIKSPVNVAGFWLDILADRTRDGLVPNKVAIDHVNALIVKERIEYSGRYRAMLEQRVKDTGQWFLLDKFSKQDSSGNYIVDESAILRQQMNTTSSNNELMQKLTPEQLKFYNQTFLDIKEEEKNKKNWLGKGIKGFKEKLSKFDLTEFTDDIFKEGFINVYKKFNGENSDKAAEKKWEEILKDVDKVKKFFVNGYEQLSSEVKRAWDKFEIKTFYEALTLLGDKVDKSFHNLRNKLIYEEDGKNKLKDISELTEEEWYDWFVSINNIDTVLETFNGTSALSQVLRSVLPDHIQALLIAARNDKELIKNMKLTANQYSGTDAENVSKRMKINKEAARKAIEKANKSITARMTSHVGSTTKSNMDDDDYRILREANIKMHEDEYSQMIKVDTEKFDENSQIDIAKEQINVLKSIDQQLGIFYHAFIDTNFRHQELVRMTDGKITGDQGNYELGAEITKLLDVLNNPQMSGWHTFAKEQLKQNGFANENAAKEWLNDRNDTLKDTRSRLDYHRHYNTGAIDITTGAVLQSNAELDKLTSDEALRRKYGKDIHINDELRYQEKYIAQRKMLRKHYIQLLKTSYIKDNSNNPIYTYFASLIISRENEFLNNINATINDEEIYNAVIDFILKTDDDDSRRSVIRYLRLLLVRDKKLTSSIRQEDISIGVIQEFLPIRTDNILQYALNYIKEVEAHSNTSANAIITDMNNITNIDINNSSYDAILAMRADKEKELDKLNKDIADIYSGEDDVYISKEDRRKRDELLISRDAAKVGLKTINTAIQNLENSRMRRISKDKTGVYADSHSSFISELAGKDNLNYSEAIKYIENIGRSPLRRQNTDNKLISNAQYADMQTVVDAVDAIRTNYSTEKDIAENGSDTLNRMLTGIYQYIKQTNKTPNDKDIKDIYHSIIHTASSNNKRKHASGGSYTTNALPIDKHGGYVDQPTDILGGTGIAGEAGGETILPHKFNERFKELIYRCLKDTAGENIARRVLGMLKPSETTQDKLGILLSDNDKVKFASGGSTAPTNVNIQTDTDTTNKKDEYTRKHPTDTIKNILLNIMESNEAIYSKLGDGLLVVDLAAALDKLKNTELINKLKSLKISEKIKNFIFGTYERGKGLVGNVLGLSKRIAFGAVNNVTSFGRHLVLGSKVCDVFLKSDIEGQVHGDKKIRAAELENGTIFSDAKCTKPIYSVADIYPPVYRKKTDKNGNTTIEEAINEEEAKPGLVDVNGNPLTYFGGKVGRFLHNIAMKPINAIFSRSALEKVKNIGSSISSGIRHGFDGLFGAYCDVYSARDPKKMLVSGTSIKEGRLVRIPKEGDTPRVVPTVFDIDGECWIMIDDPNDATKRILGNKVIIDDDIKAGLQHRDGTPIESSKLSLAMSRLRRLAGAAGSAIAGLAGGAFGIAGKVIKFAWNTGKEVVGWAKDRIKDAFTAKDPYIDVCVVKKGKLEVVITGEDLKTNKATLKYCFRDDSGNYVPVLSAYGIDKPVYTMVGKNGQTLKRPRCVITKEDLENGIFDTNGNRLTEWAGRSLAGKIGTAALGAVKLSWRAIKGIGKGIWNVGTTVIGKLGSLLGEGGAAVTSIITNAWNSTLDLFRNTVISRRDLQEIVGDRLLDIYGLLYKYMPREERIIGDKDGDGDVDGSWADYEQKRKERESKREQKRLDKWYQDHPNAARGDNMSFMRELKNAFLSGFGGKEESSGGFLDWVLGALGIKSFFPGKGAKAASTAKAGAGKVGLFKRLFSPIAKLFAKPHAVDGKLESGKLYNLGKGIKEFFTGNKLTGKTGIIGAANDKLASAGNWFKGLFGKGAAKAGTVGAASAARTAATAGATSAASKSVFTKLLGSLGPKVAARVAAIAGSNAAPIVGQIASVGMTLWSVYEIGKWLVTDSPKTKNMRSIRCKGYGVNSKYWEAIIDLETDTFEELIDGNTNGVDRDRLIKFGYKVDFLDLSNPDSEKVEFLTTWYRQRFIPAYNFYLGCMRTVGVEFDDDPPKDDSIPEEKYAVFVTEFTKHIDKFSNGPTKILRLDNSAYTAWLAHKHEKERDEGLTSSKYSDRNLADKSISKSIENPLDTLGYAWNELKHGNVLNSLWFAGKAVLSKPTYVAAKTVDVIWKNITSYLSIGLSTDQRSNNEKAWDEVRFKLYGLDKDNVSKEEYSRMTKIIKEFEVNQIHVIDGEQQVLDDELKDLAKELFPAKVRKDVKNRLMLTSNFTDNVSDDLLSESRSFVFSWYKRIFVPIFTAYARVVRSACGDEPGDNISIDSIPEENRLPLLKEFERQSNRFLATNIDTEILRLSSKGFYDFLVMRSEEDKAELAKDAQGLLTEEETTFSDKLSRNLNKAGKDFSDAWDALKQFNVVKAFDKTAKGIRNTVIGVFKSIGTSIGESIADFFHGSKNEHAWEERFFDYGFTDRAGSSDIFINSNIRAMNEFEKEAGRILLEDNTSKPDDKFFISLAFSCKYIEKCCASLFGIALNSLEALWQVMPASMATGKLSLSVVKTMLIKHITSKLSEDKNKAQQVEDVSQKISDMLNYLDFWYTFRFKPVFGTFINVVSQYGVDAADIDVDDIPVESRKEALEQYRKMVSSVLKKNNIQRYNLSPEGLAIYLDELYAYREDIKDGRVDNKYNPLAAYYKEKEETYKSEVINAVVANAFGLSKEDKAHVANSLAKASTEIDNELNDVSLMATISAKDALKDLGVDSLVDTNYNKAEATIVGKLMELTTGYNNYDKLGVGSGFLWDDKLGEVFTDFMEDAHEYLYKGGSAEDLHEALTRFMNIYLESKVFRTDGLTQDVNTLDNIMLHKYPNVAASNATFKYFANWFSHRFIPYYTYYVTLVNKANKVNDKDEPELGKLTSTHRRYVLMKLLGADKKNLIPNKAKALKLTQQDMDDFYRKENAITEQRTQTTKSKRQSREELQKQLEDIRKRYEEKRAKTYAESNSTESSRTETNNLSTIKAVDGVATGATVGGRYAKNKGTSLSAKDRQYVWDFLISQLGLTEPQASAVMGNMMQESGLSCDVVNGIGATGICQWLGNRLYGGNGYVGLIPFAEANGLDYKSVEAQMKYLQWELTHNKYERDRFDAFVRSIPTDQNDIDKTIAQCTVGFRKGYERCGEHEANDAKRVSYAKAMYNTFNTSGDSTNARNTNSTSSVPSRIARYSDGESSTAQIDSTMNTSSSSTTTTSSLPSHIARYGNTDSRNTVSSKDDKPKYSSLDSFITKNGDVDTSRLKPNFVSQMGAALAEYNKQTGDKAIVNSGYRDDKKQAELVVRNMLGEPGIGTGRGKGVSKPEKTTNITYKGKQYTIPGSGKINRHKDGTAMDVSKRTANLPLLARIASKFGITRPYASEPWHFQLTNSSIVPDTTVDAVLDDSTPETRKQSEKSLTQQVKDTVKSKIESDMTEASANVKSMYADNTTTEQSPTYTYTNMTGEGDNKHILTQNAMQSSITGANNGSAPIVAELQLISKILSEFRGDVVGFINTLLAGASSSGKTEQPRSVNQNNNKAGLLTANNVDENTIKDIGDKLLTYVSGVISAATKSNITSSRNTSNILANAYPLSSSKTR